MRLVLKKSFQTIELARRFVERLPKKGYTAEIFETRKKRRRLKIIYETVSYLRKVKGKKRRVRVTYQREIRRIVVRAVRVFEVVYGKYQRVRSLPEYLAEIKEAYGIPKAHISYPRSYLKWIDGPSKFWGWSKTYPPYRGLVDFVKVEVWAVVSRKSSREAPIEYFVWAYSRAEGLTVGISWDHIEKTIQDLKEDVMEMIEKKRDYLELHEFIGWTGYPDADWYKNTVRKFG